MRSDRTTILATILSTALLPLGGSVAAQPGDEAAVSLEGTEWQLARMAARGPWETTVRFDPAGSFAATTPCFEIDGSYALAGDSIEIEAAAVDGSESDDVACDIVQEAGADLFLDALDDAASWTVGEDGSLAISPGSGSADLELLLTPLEAPEPVEAPSSESFTGVWTLVDIVAQTGEPAQLPEGFAVELELDATGTVRGFGGCSSYEGSYVFDESAVLSIGGLVADEGADCDPTFASVQSEYLRLLGSADELTVEEGRLVLGTDPWGFDLTFAAAD